VTVSPTLTVVRIATGRSEAYPHHPYSDRRESRGLHWLLRSASILHVLIASGAGFLGFPSLRLAPD
jgi:hypothetical protein